MDTRTELAEAVKQACVKREGKMTLRCADAFVIAKQCGATLESIGRLCNEQHVKIVQCQLGCFK